MIKHKHEWRCWLPAWLAAKDKAGGSISLVKCEFCILLADSFAGVECSAWSVGRPILAQPARKILASENLISCRPSTVALQSTRRPSNKAWPALVSSHYIHMALHNLAFQPPAASPAAALHCGAGAGRPRSALLEFYVKTTLLCSVPALGCAATVCNAASSGFLRKNVFWKLSLGRRTAGGAGRQLGADLLDNGSH